MDLNHQVTVCGIAYNCSSCIYQPPGCSRSREPSLWRAVLGRVDLMDSGAGQSREVLEIHIHPLYLKDNRDLALIRLKSPVILDSPVYPLCLPPDPVAWFVGMSCVATGWGLTDGRTSLSVVHTSDISFDILVSILSDWLHLEF
ncbi:TMPRSS4 [Cordylochernes scorpioides]|uniref:TMPRSS4 n=1 Tax=Cordylochernes scorpioides TaxID=51811 RepID=A0ABY6LCP9_9ARAC|nr:TMPRSS4 [Cordylochernes scorpioides]